MNYPKTLFRNGRGLYPENKIKHHHRMYARHKPGYDWIVAEGLPDFSKIKIEAGHSDANQSFNWSMFSLAHWVRFNPDKTFLENYAVISFRVKVIRNVHLFNPELKVPYLGVEHKPDEENFSHCQLYSLPNFDKAKKRSIRLTLKHKARTELRPNEKPTMIKLLAWKIRSFIQRIGI